MRKKNIALTIVLLLLLSLWGCDQNSTPKKETTPAINDVTPIVEKQITDTPKDTLESEATEQPKFEKILDASVFNVDWNTIEGEFMSGTSSCIEVDFSSEPILITAFHYFGPDDAENFSGSDMPDYVLGGQIYDAVSGDTLDAQIKEVIVLEDAAPIPDVTHDLSAFYIEGTENITPLKLAEEMPSTGDTIYLLANLWDTEIPNENCIYEAEVLGILEDVLYYELSTDYGTTGASGAPIVNGNGEVVGIHIGSSESTRIALPKDVIYDTLKAVVSN